MEKTILLVDDHPVFRQGLHQLLVDACLARRRAFQELDLGPEGGDGGGEVIATGTPEDVAGNSRSFTGQYLKSLLRETRARQSA